MCGQISDLEIVYCGRFTYEDANCRPRNRRTFCQQDQIFLVDVCRDRSVEKRSCHRPVTGDGTDQEPVVSRSNPPLRHNQSVLWCDGQSFGPDPLTRSTRGAVRRVV